LLGMRRRWCATAARCRRLGRRRGWRWTRPRPGTRRTCAPRRPARAVVAKQTPRGRGQRVQEIVAAANGVGADHVGADGEERNHQQRHPGPPEPGAIPHMYLVSHACARPWLTRQGLNGGRRPGSTSRRPVRCDRSGIGGDQLGKA
jgi:hypothetical protein